MFNARKDGAAKKDALISEAQKARQQRSIDAAAACLLETPRATPLPCLLQLGRASTSPAADVLCGRGGGSGVRAVRLMRVPAAAAL